MNNNCKLQKIENILEVNKNIEKSSNDYEKIMFIYKAGIKEIQNKIEILQEEAKLFYNYDLIDHINTRLKTPESIIRKMKNRQLEYTYKEMIKNINDIAGIRIICIKKEDIYKIRKLIENIPGTKIIKEKDYITNPKPSGYSSYHIVINVPVCLSQRIIYVKVEIQIRTLAMHFWASIEHKAKYKSNNEITKKEAKQLIQYAKIINKLDSKMMSIKT